MSKLNFGIITFFALMLTMTTSVIAETIETRTIVASLQVNYENENGALHTAIQGKFQLLVEQEFPIKLMQIDTNHYALISVLVQKVNMLEKTVQVQVSRTDFTEYGLVTGYPYQVNFTHYLGRGPSKIRLVGPDSAILGPMQISLNF